MRRRWFLYGLAMACLAGQIQAIVFSSSWWWFGLGAVYAVWGYMFGADEYRGDHAPDEMLRWLSAITMGLLWLIAYPLTLVFCSDEIKEYDRGRHRQTEAHTPNPSPGTSAVAHGPLQALGASHANASMTVPSSWRVPNPNQPYVGGPHPNGPVQFSDPPSLEVVKGDMPILAHRAARIMSSRTGLSFAALNNGFGMFGIDADAECGKMRESRSFQELASQMRVSPSRLGALYGKYVLSHEVPGPDCTCGFYAVPADVDVPHTETTVDLMVELSGTVIEHERGYRAGHQRIVECLLPRCRYCGAPSDIALFAQDEPRAFVCERHVLGGWVEVTRADLAHQLGVPIGSIEP